MHTESKEPLRVTHDSSTYIGAAEISPDGSQILYTINYDFYIIPSLGGVRKKIAVNFFMAKWRPDGKLIGLLKENYPKKESLSFWTIKPDGSDLHLEFVDEPKMSNFCWSPEGNSIAGADGEMFIKDLKSGKRKQITFDKKNVYRIWWAKNGVIFFSYNNDDNQNMNIWMMPEIGGDAIQITKGTAADFIAGGSADWRKILYYQLAPYCNIWLRNLKTSKFNQITSNERLVINPAFSPDRSKIAFTIFNFTLRTGDIFLIDRDGSNQRQLTFSKLLNETPIYSPDGKYIAYTEYDYLSQFGLPDLGSMGKVFIINSEGSDSPKFVDSGKVGMWADNSSLVIIKNYFTEIVSIDGIKKDKVYIDSTIAFPVSSGKFILYLDLHKNNSGKYYLIPADYQKNPLSNIEKYLLLDNEVRQFIINQDYFYWLNNKLEIWRYQYLSSKKEKFGDFPSIMNYWGGGFNVSVDNEEMIYFEHKVRNKLMLIEDAFVTK